MQAFGMRHRRRHGCRVQGVPILRHARDGIAHTLQRTIINHQDRHGQVPALVVQPRSPASVGLDRIAVRRERRTPLQEHGIDPPCLLSHHGYGVEGSSGGIRNRQERFPGCGRDGTFVPGVGHRGWKGAMTVWNPWDGGSSEFENGIADG